MLITVLRDLSVTGDDGEQLPVSGARLRRLLVRLAVDAGQVVSAGELTETIWLDEPPADPPGALQALVSRLRRAVGPVVEQSGSGYRLTVEASSVDLHRFEQFVAGARYADALALLDGPPLPLVADQPWALPLVARVEQQALDAQEALLEDRLAAGDLDGVVVHLRDLVATHPLHEAFAGQLIRALTAQGRPAEALAAYEQTREALADALGTDPSEALQTLHLDLLRADRTPAPRAPGSVLRTGLTSFIGRDGELASLARDLAAHRLVTLVGPGGAGKTRLATETGIAWRAEHGAAVWLVELAPLTDPGAVLPAFVTALDLQGSRVLERLRDAGRAVDDWSLLTAELSAAAALLIVDNCEHLLDATAQLIDQLLVTVPAVRIVATSREPLAVDGEQVRSIPSLAPAAGEQLFLDRAASAGQPVAAAELPVVAEIVRRLDGLPLAIELAAARVRTLSVSVIAERLSDRFALLTGGRRTALPRHRTLFAVVAWSWDLLTQPERDLLQRFSVFAGGAEVSAVEAVTGRPDADLLLASLVDKSLLVVDRGRGGLRYRMLETIREFSADRLSETGLGDRVRQAHARWVLDFVRAQDDRLRGPGQVEALAALESEADNVLAALHYFADSADAQRATELVMALSWSLFVLDDDHRTASLARIALDSPGDVDPAMRALVQVMLLAARAATGAIEVATAREGMRRATMAVDRDDAVYQRMPHSLIIVLQASVWSDLPELTDRLSRRTLEHGDPWIRAAALQSRIDIAENAGDQEEVRRSVRSLEILVESLDDRWLTASMLVRRSQVEAFEGDPQRAMVTLRRAQELIGKIGRSGDEMFLAMRTMDLRLRLGDYDGAREAVTGIPAQWRELIGVDVPNSFLITIAVAQEDPARLAEARRVLGQPQPVVGTFHDHSKAIVQIAVALLEAEEGDLVAARRALEAAYEPSIATADMPIVAGYAVSAAAALSRTHPEQAAEALGAAAAIRGTDDPGDPIVTVLTRRLRAALSAGFDPAYGRGRAKDRAAAIADVDPARLFD